MTNVTILALVLSCVLATLTVVLYFSKQKSQRQLDRLNGKIIELEAKTPVPQSVVKKSEERRPAPRVTQEDTTSGKELVLLRKEFAKIRDDNRSLRDLLKESETSLSEARRGAENSLYSLKEENRALLQQLKEMSPAPRKQFTEPPPVKDESQIALKRLQAQLEESEKRIKFEAEKSNQHFEKIRQLQIEIKRWQEASSAVGGKPVSPSELIRWHDRAMEGRRMYQLMKQLRELSDEKLVRYQTTIVPLATFVLTQKEKPLPDLKQGEVLADRYLTAALNALTPQ